MYPVKVKDYTRLGGWLALFAVLTALRSVKCLLALVRIPLQLATYGTYGMGLYYVLEGINLVVGALGAACIVLLAQRKGAVLRRMFLITGAVNVSAFGLELAGLIAFSAHSQVSALSSVQQVAFYGIWYLYLLRSRRVAVYFGEAQPMWYECGQPGPCGAQPPYGAPGQPPYSYGPQGPGARPVPPQGAYAPPAAPQPPQQAAAPFAYQPQAAQSSVPPARPAPPQATPAQPGPGAMVCPACGMQGAPGASFCTVCGAHLVPAAQAPAQPKEGEPHV